MGENIKVGQHEGLTREYREYKVYGGKDSQSKFEKDYQRVYKQVTSILKDMVYRDIASMAYNYERRLFEPTLVAQVEYANVTVFYRKNPHVRNKEDVIPIALATLGKIDTTRLHNVFIHLRDRLFYTHNLLVKDGTTPYIDDVGDLRHTQEYLEVQEYYMHQMKEVIDARYEMYTAMLSTLPEKEQTNSKLIQLMWKTFIASDIRTVTDPRYESTLHDVYHSYLRSERSKSLVQEYQRNPREYEERYARMYRGVEYRIQRHSKSGNYVDLGVVEFKPTTHQGIKCLDLKVRKNGDNQHYMLSPYSIYSHGHGKYLLKGTSDTTMADYDKVLSKAINDASCYAEVDSVVKYRKLNIKLP